MLDYCKVLQTGITASAATTVAAAVCGALEQGNSVAPINAVSHIPWGDEAARHDELSWKYTATGLGLNTAAVTSWAAIYEWGCRNIPDDDAAGALTEGVLVSALAYLTDYHVVPRRLTPGFEKRLSNYSLLGIYATLALSLALGRRTHSRSRSTT